jgi:glycosyltransferase involved in cell wall biosynthesis
LIGSRTESRVVRSGVSIPERIDATDRHEGRRRLGLPEDTFTIGTVGNLFPFKGQRFLLDAFRRLESREDRLVIIGGGPLEAALRNDATSMGVADRTVFAGSRPDAADLTSAFDVFVQPSLAEGMPIALLEAMGRGVAAIATAVGGTSEIITHGDTGVLVRAGDPKQLSAAITTLRRDTVLRNAIARRGRERVRKDFSLAMMVAGYQEIYRHVRRGTG